MNPDDPRSAPDPHDIPGYGRVGGIDDPVPRAEYGDDPERAREGRRTAATDPSRDPPRDADRNAGPGSDPDADTDPEPANVTLYYLPFGPSEPVRDLRFRLRQDDATPTFAEFVTHYRKAGEDRAASLGEVWRQWNAGSGGESEAFRAAEERSLSVGDIVVLDDEAHLCKRIGWTRPGWDERELRAARIVWLLADIHERVVAAANALAGRIPGHGGNSRSDGAEDDS